MQLIRYYGDVCLFLEMKFFVVIFLVTLLMVTATVSQELSEYLESNCCEL